MYFQNKGIFMKIIVYLIQTTSYVIEMAKENYTVKFIMKIVLYSCGCNKIHLLSCQIYVNELKMTSVSSS